MGFRGYPPKILWDRPPTPLPALFLNARHFLDFVKSLFVFQFFNSSKFFDSHVLPPGKVAALVFYQKINT